MASARRRLAFTRSDLDDAIKAFYVDKWRTAVNGVEDQATSFEAVNLFRAGYLYGAAPCDEEPVDVRLGE